MPHYKNGREAKVGDIAFGTTYNRPGQQVGVIVGITPNADSCNCRLAMEFNATPIGFDLCLLVPKIIQTYTDTSKPGFDYTAVGDLLHIEDYLLSLVPNPITVTEGHSTPTL